MNAQLIGSAITSFMVVSFYFIFRGYKRVSRRCRWCGGLFSVERVHFIILPVEEESQRFRFIDPTSGKFRWFVWGVRTSTFAHCKNCLGMPSRIWVVKTKTDPLSVWHLRHVRKYHPEQFERPAGQYRQAVQNHIKELERFGPGELDKGLTSTPSLLIGISRDIKDLLERIRRTAKKWLIIPGR